MLRPKIFSGTNVSSVPSSFHVNVPFNGPSVPLNRKLDFTLSASIGWLNVNLISAPAGIGPSLFGSNETTLGLDVVNFQVFVPPPSKPTPVTVFKAGFKLTVCSAPPAMDGAG